MQSRKRSAVAAVLLVAALGVLAPVVLAGPDASATVLFGNDDVGSPFPPITGHDQSGNGKFNLIPRTVTIAAGGTVTYDIFVRFGFHEPKVYDVPEEIDREIARLKLEAEGVEIDTLTEEQAKYLASWDEGT